MNTIKLTNPILLSTLVFASGNMYAKLGVTVQNESTEKIEVRITNGIKGSIKIPGCEVKGKKRQCYQDFLPSGDGLRVVFWRTLDKNGKPKETDEYFTEAYLKPDLIIIKDNPKEDSKFIYDITDLATEKDYTKLGKKKDSQKKDIKSKKGGDYFNNPSESQTKLDFTGVRVINGLHNTIEAQIGYDDKKIKPTEWVEVPTNWMQKSKENTSDIPSMSGNRYIKWRIKGQPGTEWETSESYLFPDTITIRNNDQSYKKLIMVYDMISGVAKTTKKNLQSIRTFDRAKATSANN